MHTSKTAQKNRMAKGHLTLLLALLLNLINPGQYCKPPAKPPITCLRRYDSKHKGKQPDVETFQCPLGIAMEASPLIKGSVIHSHPGH